MRITFKLFAGLARHLPPDARHNMIELEVADGASAHAVIDQFQVPRAAAHLVLVNGIYVEPDDRDRASLAEGDVLAVWPPVAGG